MRPPLGCELSQTSGGDTAENHENHWGGQSPVPPTNTRLHTVKQ